jgi:hypothetical protein
MIVFALQGENQVLGMWSNLIRLHIAHGEGLDVVLLVSKYKEIVSMTSILLMTQMNLFAAGWVSQTDVCLLPLWPTERFLHSTLYQPGLQLLLHHFIIIIFDGFFLAQ